MSYPYIIALCGAIVLLLGCFIMIRTTSFGIMPRLRWLLRNNTSKVIFTGFTLVIAGICLVAWASVRSIEKFQANSILLAQSNDVINTINELRLDTANGSSTQRGALIAGSNLYKTTFATYFHKYAVDADKLKRLVADNPVQVERAATIKKLLDTRFAGWQASLDVRNASGFEYDQALAVVNENADTAVRLRDLFSAMQQTEANLLAERNIAFRRGSQNTLAALILATALSALLALAILLVITLERRSVARAQRKSQLLQAEQKELLRQLRQQTKNIASQRVRDRAMLKSIGEGLVATDEYGHISSVNPAALEMLGYTNRELSGHWYTGTIAALDENGEELDPLDRPITQAVSTGKIVAATVTFRRKDQTTFPAFVTASPLLLRGKPVGVVEVFRDITKERELEAAKEEFVSLASHQLRTPAAGVKAFASMLLDGYGGKVTEQQREFLQQIYDSNERQLRIVDDLLSVARVDAGRMVLNRTETDIAKLVRAITSEAKPLVEERRQSLTVQIAPNIPTISADSDKLHMVVDNLLSNASKYTPSGGSITVKVTGRQSGIQVAVSDNGVGIAKADIARLFDKFSRIPNTRSEKVGGTGLGLYLAYQIARLHGGSVTVTSRLGKGSRFTLKLPLSKQLMYGRSKGSNVT